MIYRSREELIEAGYHYFLTSVNGDYLNSAYTNKKAAVAALEGINYQYRSVMYCSLVLVTNQDL